MKTLLCLWLALAPLAMGELAPPPYAKFPAVGTDLLFSLFQTTYSFATEAEEPYPVIFQVTKQGVPLWSQMAHIDREWPFLSIECKVAWSPNFQHCAAAYRSDRATLVVFTLDFTGDTVRQQTLPIEDLADSVFERSGDTKGRAPVKVLAESLEITNDASVKLALAATRAQTHRVTASFDGKSGQLKSVEPAK